VKRLYDTYSPDGVMHLAAESHVDRSIENPLLFVETNVIPLTILRASRGESLPVYGRGENVRDWLHVTDHARALRTVLERGTPGETYCIGGRSEKRNIDIVRAICDVLDQRLGRLPAGPRRELIAFVADRPGHDLRYAIDAGRIEAKLGWQPAMSIEAGLQNTIDWYLANDPGGRRW
jgi:dTDP-glucose 4,6-dehydratase